MRFSVLAATFLISAVVAETETSYITEIHTKTQCAASITNCPARSTIISTTSYPASAPPPTSSPSGPIVYYNTSSVAVPPPSTYLPPPPPASTTPASPATSSPGGLVSTITISTCVPTVIYSTITVTPAPTSSPAGPIGGGGAAPSGGSTGTISIPHNVTAPTAPASPSGYETSGASAVQGSVVVAAFAGLAAFLFA